MALLGSNRARQILALEGDTGYEGYDTEFRRLEREFKGIETSQWTKGLYWNWLGCLKTLLKKTYSF